MAPLYEIQALKAEEIDDIQLSLHRHLLKVNRSVSNFTLRSFLCLEPLSFKLMKITEDYHALEQM